MVKTEVVLCGTPIKNPVIPASGTFGFGAEFAELYDINCLGSISIKGTTAEERFGNPTPRIAETPAGMLNAVGLQNPGADRVTNEELPRLARLFDGPVMANVSGFSVSDFIIAVEKLDPVPNVGWFEINISCPNVHGGGMAFGTDPEAAAEVTAAVRGVTKKPVVVKLSPEAVEELTVTAEDGSRGTRPEEYMVRRGERLVTRVRIQSIRRDGSNLAIAENLSDWQQTPVAPGDEVFF